MIKIEIEYKPNRKAAKNLSDLQDALTAWYAYMTKQTDEMFLYAGGSGSATAGGEYRGVRWKPFSPQYVRKDGTEVPAWGGIPKVDGSGFVKPRIRPSGQPITPASWLLQDTGRLRQRATTDVVRVTPSSLIFGTNLEYAGAQNDIRPFLFVTEDDAQKLAEMVAEKIEGAINGKE